ncbi:MAG: hypothetical protein ABIY48_02465, partial [Acidimicrobiales bacterium]
MSNDQLTTPGSDRATAAYLGPLGLDATTDADLVDATAATIAEPRAQAADSFILHAPLELLSRAALLPMVEPNRREAARERLRSLADSFVAWGAAADSPPDGKSSFGSEADALTTLQAAVAGGELDDADGAAAWLADRLGADELRSALADVVLPLLSAAGHGSIFLYHLPRVAPRSADAARMLRSLVRELARNPGWDLSWFRTVPVPSPRLAGSPTDLAGELAQRLVRPPSPGHPGSDFIFPMMSLNERSGLAQAALHDLVPHLPLADARRVLLRTAAQSMLQDDPTHAPYGWSHCLTMPQAALGVAASCAEPWHATAVAATYVLTFRAIQGGVALDHTWTPERPVAIDLAEVLGTDPHRAAATAFHAAPADRPAIRASLASRAAAHHDAHLVKHTLA